MPAYNFRGYMKDGKWVRDVPPYPVVPLLQDLICLELYERGGSFIMDRRRSGQGAISQIIALALGTNLNDLFQLGSRAANALVKKKWVARNYFDPKTGSRGYAVHTATLLMTPTPEHLAKFTASREVLRNDFGDSFQALPPQDGTGYSHALFALTMRVQNGEQALASAQSFDAQLTAGLKSQIKERDAEITRLQVEITQLHGELSQLSHCTAQATH